MEYTRIKLFKDKGGICVTGSHGAQIVAGLEVKPEDYILVKKRFSANGGHLLGRKAGSQINVYRRSFGELRQITTSYGTRRSRMKTKRNRQE